MNMDSPLSPSHLSHLIGLPLSSPIISKWLNTLSSTSTDIPTQVRPQIKSYPDVQYHLYFSLGIDLIFTQAQSGEGWVLDRVDIYNPSSGSALTTTTLTTRRRAVPVYNPPCLPLVIRPVLAPPATDPAEAFTPTSPTSPSQNPNVDKIGVREVFEVDREKTGRDFVSALGEPSRKGGGTASQGLSLGVGPWLEWSNLRILAYKTSHTGSSPITSEERDGGEWEEVGIGLMVELRESLRGVTEDDMRKGLGGVWDRAAGWEWSCMKFFRVGSTL